MNDDEKALSTGENKNAKIKARSTKKLTWSQSVVGLCVPDFSSWNLRLEARNYIITARRYIISSIYICLPCMILNLLNVDAVLEVNGNDRYGKNKEKSKGVIGITKPSKHTWTPEVLKVLLHWGTRSLTWFSLLAKLLAAWSLSFFYITGAWETMNSGFQDTFFLLHLLWRPGY